MQNIIHVGVAASKDIISVLFFFHCCTEPSPDSMHRRCHKICVHLSIWGQLSHPLTIPSGVIVRAVVSKRTESFPFSSRSQVTTTQDAGTGASLPTWMDRRLPFLSPEDFVLSGRQYCKVKNEKRCKSIVIRLCNEYLFHNDMLKQR